MPRAETGRKRGLPYSRMKKISRKRHGSMSWGAWSWTYHRCGLGVWHWTDLNNFRFLLLYKYDFFAPPRLEETGSLNRHVRFPDRGFPKGHKSGSNRRVSQGWGQTAARGAGRVPQADWSPLIALTSEMKISHKPKIWFIAEYTEVGEVAGHFHEQTPNEPSRTKKRGGYHLFARARKGTLTRKMLQMVRPSRTVRSIAASSPVAASG